MIRILDPGANLPPAAACGDKGPEFSDKSRILDKYMSRTDHSGFSTTKDQCIGGRMEKLNTLVTSKE
jgi:hypothetical protein